MPDRSHRDRRSQRSGQPRQPRQGVAARLHAAGRIEYASAHHLCGARGQHRSGAGVAMAIEPGKTSVSNDIGVLRAGWGYASVSDKIADLVLRRPPRWPWIAAFLFTFAGVLVFFGAVAYLFAVGVGIWGVN